VSVRRRLRARAGRAVGSAPLYRLLPPGAARTYAGLRYHRDAGGPELALERIGTPERVRSLPVALAAARQAVRQGYDDLARQLLAAAEERHQPVAGIELVRADLAAFLGDEVAALDHADRARALDPSAAAAAARAVRLRLLLATPQAADEALEAVARFPRSAAVLWAAAKGTHDPEQYRRLIGAWRAASRPADLAGQVPALATAAARAGLLTEAIALHLEALLTSPGGRGSPRSLAEPRLAGRGAWRAIEDLTDALDGGGVPFFFAAGTALGLVREGRPLDLDGDIDVGIHAEDFDRDALLELFRAHPAFALDVDHPGTEKVRLRHRGGSPVDVFRFYEDGGRVWHDGVFVRWWNSPFRVERRPVGTAAFPVPADAERYLTENYGDWRVPEPGFDAFVDAPNLELTWPDYLDLHRVRRAYRSLSAGQVAAGFADLAAIDDAVVLAALEVPGERVDAGAPRPATGPAEGTDLALGLARHLHGRGQRDAAVDALVRAVRAGGWERPHLWADLLHLMARPDDYATLRSLWLSGPASCRSNVAIMRTVARAACVAGEHDEGRALLRAAIVAAARDRRLVGRPPSLVARRAAGTVKRAVLARARPRPSFEQDARQALSDLHDELHPLGVRPFLISGTLLGYVRDGDVIPWDKDIDLGVFSEQIASTELEAAVASWPRFTAKRLDWTNRLRIDHANGVKIDVFPHYPEGPDRVWHDGTATRWWNTPFGVRTVSFLGLDQAVPDNPERYLDENYGDWRTPDPYFDARLDAPNREITDRPYFDSLQYFALLAAVLAGDERKQQRYTALLRALGEGAWLERL
jgi:tetratricopeptide (TPR) repeat protein